MRKVTKGFAPLVALALVAAACGGDDDAEPAADPTEESSDEPSEEMSEDMTEEPTEDMSEDMTEESSEEPAEVTSPPPAEEIATDVGVTDDTILIGLNADLSGLFAPLVTQIVDGQEAYWEIVNDNGGIAGRMVELVIKDNGYDVPTHMENYAEMADTGDEGVIMFSQSTGSPHTATSAPDLVKDDLLAIPLSWYSGWAEPGELGSNVMELYTSYCIEAMNGVEHLTNTNDAKTLAIVSFPGEYGQDGAAGAKIAAAELGLEIVYDGEGAVVPGSDQTPVITELVKADPDIVWATLNPGTLAEVFGGAYAQGLRAKWSGNSPTWNYQLLATDLATAADDVYVHSTYTALWDAIDTPGMTEMIEGMRAKRPDAVLSDTYIVAWTEGMATKAVLEQAAANGDMTRAGVVAALAETAVDFKGLAPDQTWGGDANDFIVRESYLYDVDLASYTPGATVSDDGGTGFILEAGPYVGEVAANFTFTEACFKAG